MPKFSSQQQAYNDLITKKLLDKGWELTEKSQAFKVAELSYQNPFKVDLEIEYLWKQGAIMVRAMGGELFSFIYIKFGHKLEEIIETVTSFQDDLDQENYRKQIAKLLQITKEVYVDTGDDLVLLEE